MAIASHFGIRYANDLSDEFSEFIIDSVDLLNAQLALHGLSFFFDSIDVDQRVIGGKYCENMFRIRADLARRRGREAWGI